VPVAVLPVHFPARDDRHLAASDEPDAAAEERDDVLSETETEREGVGAFEEERPLLGEEQRKACEVRPARVNFGLREVGIDGERCEYIGPEPLRHIEARLRIA